MSNNIRNGQTIQYIRNSNRNRANAIANPYLNIESYLSVKRTSPTTYYVTIRTRTYGKTKTIQAATPAIFFGQKLPQFIVNESSGRNQMGTWMRIPNTPGR
jgi:hypothetical protein